MESVKLTVNLKIDGDIVPVASYDTREQLEKRGYFKDPDYNIISSYSVVAALRYAIYRDALYVQDVYTNGFYYKADRYNWVESNNEEVIHKFIDMMEEMNSPKS